MAIQKANVNTETPVNLTANDKLMVINELNLNYINSISDLKQSEVFDDKEVNVLGYYTKGDGGGGLFYWDSTSDKADNGGTIIQATGITIGRWKRIYSGAVNVKWFGAKGDGVFDDKNKIQEALDFASEIYIPQGDYFISDKIFPRSSQKITGAGKKVANIIPANVVSYGVIYMQGVHDVTINHITLDHSVNNTESNGFLIVDTGYPNNTNTGTFPKNISIDNVDIIGFTHHEYLVWSFASNIKITNCTIDGETTSPSGQGQELIEFGSGNDILVDGCTLKNCDNAGINFFSNTDRSNVRIVNNYFENCSIGVNGNLTTTANDNIIISNNTIINSASYGINFSSSGGGSFNNSIISNNVIRNVLNNNGVSLNAGGVNLLFKDNLIENTGGNGVQLRNFKNLSVQGNNIKQAGDYGINILGTSIGSSKDIYISSNLISDTQDLAIRSVFNKNIFIRKNTILRWNLIDNDIGAITSVNDEYINVDNNVFLKSDAVTETECVRIDNTSSFGLMKGNRANYTPSISYTFQNLSTNSIKAENTYSAELIPNPNMFYAQVSDWSISNPNQIEITTDNILKFTNATGGNFAKATVASYGIDKFRLYIYVKKITSGFLRVRVSGPAGSDTFIKQPGFYEVILVSGSGNILSIEAPGNESVDAIIPFCSLQKMLSNNLN